MSNRIELTIRPHPGIALLRLLPWLVLAGLLLTGALANIWLLALMPVVLVAAARDVRPDTLWRRATSITGLRVDGDRLQATLADGSRTGVQVLPHSRIGSGWLWLALELEGKRRRQTLLLSNRGGFRNTDRQDLRQLTYWLRLHSW